MKGVHFNCFGNNYQPVEQNKKEKLVILFYFNKFIFAENKEGKNRFKKIICFLKPRFSNKILFSASYFDTLFVKKKCNNKYQIF